MKRAFTLIELLIVVAIIAILAAIAVPNFLEAQTRAKVSRAKADMRTCATALESYAVDWNKYPPDCTGGAGSFGNPADCIAPQYLNSTITTPVSYISSAEALVDPFNNEQAVQNRQFRYANFIHIYEITFDPPLTGVSQQYQTALGAWKITSDGPDRTFSGGGGSGIVDSNGNPLLFNQNVRYDSSNGTVSPGDIIRSQKFSDDPIY